ncbi:MAG: hypothetical protein EOO27_40530 [Comamonadaceae bacterium]|nr:MAG: hypothetical protein EOO27_40530 [Comamonadaceae bacterium]
MKPILIAAVAHAVNAAYCASIGDDSQSDWSSAPQWQKDSALAGVEMHLANPDATPEQSHAAWLAQKDADGWKFGPLKDVDKKEHPCFLPYADLPAEQRSKDYLFRAVVHALKDLPEELAVARSEPTAAAQQASATPGTEAISYIGRRNTHRDTLYGTGDWTRDETKAVPFEVSLRMLRHPDVFERSAKVPTTEAARDKADKNDDVEQDLLDLHQRVDTMTKDAVIDYAKVHFRVDLPKAEKVADLKAKLHTLINQFGVA